jgi:hypothetical protein
MDPVVFLPFSIFLVSKISIKRIKRNEIEGFFACLKMLLSIRPDLGGDRPIGKGHLAVVRGYPRLSWHEMFGGGQERGRDYTVGYWHGRIRYGTAAS